MNSDTKATLSTLGTGLTAAAAGYGASSAMGGDNASSLMTGTLSGIMAALLAHMIVRKTIKEQSPLVSGPTAGAASLFAGTTTGVGALGGLSWLENKYGNKINNFLPDLYTKGQQSGNGFLQALSGTLSNYHNDISANLNRVGTGSNSSTYAKILGPVLRNKKAFGAGLVGLATMPIIYKALRGNGSD